MSKLFPLFKRKGKGKEEEVEEESRKRHGKPRKHSKEDHHSPSPASTPPPTKPQKKRKAKEVKRRAPLPGGKDINSKTDGPERPFQGDFHVDDNGQVQPGPPLDITAIEDDHLTISKDESLQPEDKPKDSTIAKDHLHAEGKETLDVVADEDDDVSCESYPAEVNILQGPSDGQLDHGEEELSSVVQVTHEERVLNGYEGQAEDVIEDGPAASIDTEIDQEVRLSEPDKHLFSDSPTAEDVTGNVCDIYRIPPPEVKVSAKEETETVVEAEVKVVDNENTGNNELDEYSKIIIEKQTDESSENIDKLMTNDKEAISEDIVAEREVDSDHVSLVEEGDKSVHGLKDDREEVMMGKSDGSVDEDSPHISLDSDDDFDSAQEDWEENYDADVTGRNKAAEEVETMNRMTQESADGSGLSEHLEESQDNDGDVNEATNCVLINKKREDSEVSILLREPSSSSSVYQDASFSFEDNDITDISSIVDAVNEECINDSSKEDRKKKDIQPKLTRKISNISVSSDIFNEELDELLDEELDRLSEEEVEGLNQGVSPAEGVAGVDSVDNTLLGEESRVEYSSTVKTPEQEKETVAPTDISIKISDQNGNVEEAHEGGPDILQSQATEDAVSNSLGDSNSFTTISEEGWSSGKKIGSEEGAKLSTLAAPEEGLDQAKDSGYYSLPVSPKPGVSVRESEPPEVVKHMADDPFGDSEDEEGMVTPPSELAPSLDTTEKLTEKTTEINESVLGASVTNESIPVLDTSVTNDSVSVLDTSVTNESVLDTSVTNESVLDTSVTNESVLDTSVTNESMLYQTCCESQGAEEIENIDKQREVVHLGEESCTESQKDNKPKSPKLFIPMDTVGESKEGATSPRDGSTPVRPPRHKYPILECENLQQSDETLKSPDPVGDRFLKEAVFTSHEEAEARLAQRRAARAEARELRLRELEKQQQDQENDEEKQFTTPSYAGAESGGEDEDEEEEEEPTPRAAGSGRTSGRTAGLNSTGQFSRRSSEDSTTDESLPANVREMRAELKELDEKFRKAMITNAQLDNEKATLTFEVELMKDRYTELEETHTQLTKEHRKKCTEFEQLRKVSTKLQEEVKVLRGLLQERDQLIQEYGLVVVGEEENGEEGETGKEEDDMDDLSPRKIAVKKALISQEAAELLEKGAAKGSLDIRLKKFGEEKNDLEDQVRRLKLELEEERNKNRRKENGLDYEKQKEQSKTVNEYKFRVQKAEAEVSTLQANVARLDALSTRYRTQSEELEKSEEELKGERRKLQRELREAQSRLEELETTNNHLIKRFDKLKNARSTLLKDLSQEPA
ncbi:uncharacterized protein LOC121855512 isoform X2 [Homarus americanus]|uniref:uncharacterized protein LOC121855512 isoform X2 n=1 Tax=Homarus americanus TaxID=6706 RepID=UPI001C4451CE|nr:uncharacterized protein LOC121855512 isoform X2 [Homarus americanus]